METTEERHRREYDQLQRVMAPIREPQARAAHFAITISNDRGTEFTPSCRCGWKGTPRRVHVEAWPPDAREVREAHRYAGLEAAAHNGADRG